MRLLAAVLLLALSSPAFATLLEVPGEKFLDTETGYTWYDLRNFGGNWWGNGPHSVEDVLADLEGTGFHLATRAELQTLVDELPRTGELVELRHVIGWAYQMHLGGFPPDDAWLYASYGYFDDGDAGYGLGGFDFVAYHGEVTSFESWLSSDRNYALEYGSPEYGAWAVNPTPVPEPATLALFASGLALLARHRRAPQSAPESLTPEEGGGAGVSAI